jgi:N-ethylmaleimide reductase
MLEVRWMSPLKLLSPIKVGDLELPNRVFMAPLTRNRAGSGNVPSELNAQYYAQRASAGLIISEASQISTQGIGYPATPGIHTTEQIAGWRRVTDAVHRSGGRIFLQLWHCGRISHPLWQIGHVPAVAPSAVAARGTAFTPEGPKPHEEPRALKAEELPGLVADYVTGAKNAIAAGFDGVEVHAANGYLLDQFLRDGTNHRTDDFGGSIENRLRFPLSVVREIVDAVGAQRVGVRISPSSSFNDMSDSDPAATFGSFARALAPLGIAYLHILGPDANEVRPGTSGVAIKFFRPLFPGIIIANWGYSLESAEAGLRAGEFDAVSFGKAFIANPDLPERFRRGAPLNEPNEKTFYGGGAEGYTDYPALR